MVSTGAAADWFPLAFGIVIVTIVAGIQYMGVQLSGKTLIITGGIELSVGSMMALLGVLMSMMLTEWKLGVVIAVLAAWLLISDLHLRMLPWPGRVAVFLVIFAAIFEGSTIVDGRAIKLTTYYVPGIMTLGIISAKMKRVTVENRTAATMPSAVQIGR